MGILVFKIVRRHPGPIRDAFIGSDPRIQAARWLGRLNRPDAATALVRSLLDRDASVRNQVVASLRHIGWTPADARETASWSLAGRNTATWERSLRDAAALDALRAMMEWPDWDDRAKAEALARCFETAASGLLWDLLRRSKFDAGVLRCLKKREPTWMQSLEIQESMNAAIAELASTNPGIGLWEFLHGAGDARTVGPILNYLDRLGSWEISSSRLPREYVQPLNGGILVSLPELDHEILPLFDETTEVGPRLLLGTLGSILGRCGQDLGTYELQRLSALSIPITLPAGYQDENRDRHDTSVHRTLHCEEVRRLAGQELSRRESAHRTGPD